MEKDFYAKKVEWTTIIEYFTKRGRPLDDFEIKSMIEEDRKAH